MDIRPEIENLAARHKCDPRDPLLEALFDVRDELKKDIENGDHRSLISGTKKLEVQTDDLKKAIETFSAENARLEVLHGNHSKLIVSARQLKARDRGFSALLGIGIGLSVSCLFYCLWYVHSTDAVLAQANLKLLSEKSKDGIKITLSGRKILQSGQTGEKVVVEFSK